jgi:hypothetical protein
MVLDVSQSIMFELLQFKTEIKSKIRKSEHVLPSIRIMEICYDALLYGYQNAYIRVKSS